MRVDLDPGVVRHLVRYDPETGKLFWIERGPEWFADGKNGAAWNAAKWNARFAGKEAINSASASHGYFDGAILGKGVLAHRVAFVILHGRWPVGVDHIDGDRRNNRGANLREASQAENMLNAKVRSDNPTGFSGIRQLKSGAWSARIKRGGISESLGTFPTAEAAIAARKCAESRLGFHINHGRP